ncbi:Nucleotide-binding universal stress protein, UspA family [Natronorubrum sediminis]|uniref:Nucleotide-binding universal stress protein, UspA family n=1 Tax=Natronorubrum sediminis TaxID=640943 RepID=A0A1H6FMA4_9EURY|nr:universal stress protein [Natronorubrum sediminis]SEH12019.1 Nucleotide-binding universal stress protein, UspA family [Natronorubrum sediminis]
MHILVPLDNSEPAQEALEHAVSEYSDAEITVLHVINPNVSMYGEGGVYAYDSVIDSRRKAIQSQFDKAREAAAAHDVSISTETVVGNPSREIVAYADEHDIDHIVIGSQGRDGARRVLLGSVAERVVRRAPVPVTIVR